MRPFICEPLGRLCLADAPLLGLTEFHLWACPSRLGGKLFLGNYASKMAYRHSPKAACCAQGPGESQGLCGSDLRPTPVCG